MDRLTEKTIGCFEYALKDHKPVVGEFSTYDAFYNYSTAVKRLGQYEDTGLTPEEITALQEALGGESPANWAIEAAECRRETANANIERIRLDRENKQLRAENQRLREALKELAYSPVAFTDDRISYVEMQVDKDVLEIAKKALEVSADD